MKKQKLQRYQYITQKKIFFFLALLFISVLLGGCFHIKKKPLQNSGVFKSFNRGGEWQHKTLLVVAGGVRSVKAAQISALALDPQDNNAIYAGTENMGLIYSFNGGEYWQQPPQINSGKINDIAIDAKNKCVIYAAYGNRLMKSSDCTRSWQEAYIDSRPKNVTTVALDPIDTKNVYVATEFGEIIKSTDAGSAWSTVYRFNGNVKEIVINPRNPSILYAAVEDSGIFRSINNGGEWQNISESLKKNKKIFTNLKIFFDAAQNDSIYIVSKYGIIRSDDGGANWEILNLITPPLGADIYSFAINTKNSNHIYYGTATTLYRSDDRGKNWSVKKLPSNSIASHLLIDTVNPGILYLGTKLPAPKK